MIRKCHFSKKKRRKYRVKLGSAALASNSSTFKHVRGHEDDALWCYTCLLQRRPKWHLTVLTPSSGLWAHNSVPELVPPQVSEFSKRWWSNLTHRLEAQTSPFPDLPFCHPGIHSLLRQLLATENHPLPAYSPLLSQCVDRSPMGRRIISWLCTGHTKA